MIYLNKLLLHNRTLYKLTFHNIIIYKVRIRIQ